MHTNVPHSLIHLYKFKVIMGPILKVKRLLTIVRKTTLSWIYHIPYCPQAAGLIERMNGLLKEKLCKMGSIAGLRSYYKWKNHLFTALQQPNNRSLSTGGTPLSRMMTPNLQIRKIHTFPTLHWWAVHPNAQAPYMGTTASAGPDLHNVKEIRLDPNTSQTVPTGIGIQIPKGYHGQIAARSSLAQKGVQIMAGVIDADYVGEIKILLHNVSKESLHFLPGTGIAQILIIPYASTDIWETLDTALAQQIMWLAPEFGPKNIPLTLQGPERS